MVAMILLLKKKETGRERYEKWSFMVSGSGQRGGWWGMGGLVEVVDVECPISIRMHFRPGALILSDGASVAIKMKLPLGIQAITLTWCLTSAGPGH